MIFVELFFTFFLIGAVTFGGGYAMIPLIQDIIVSKGWITAEQLLNFIAVSESTPGPFAVNIATYIGSSIGGVGGAILATLGVILPAFIVILLVVTVMKKLLKYKPVNAFLAGIKPVICAIIFSTAITLILSNVFGVHSLNNVTGFHWISLVIMSILVIIYFVYYKIKNKNISPIVLILISAGLGMLMYSVF
ncbi:MAG: chromate transporter [Clostridiales bacterium]|nr:chromate transporter [Clostridiales bacterium]